MRTGVREPEWSAEAGVGTLLKSGLGSLPFVVYSCQKTREHATEARCEIHATLSWR